MLETGRSMNMKTLVACLIAVLAGCAEPEDVATFAMAPDPGRGALEASSDGSNDVGDNTGAGGTTGSGGSSGSSGTGNTTGSGGAGNTPGEGGAGGAVEPPTACEDGSFVVCSDGTTHRCTFAACP